MNTEDATKLLIKLLKNPDHSSFAKYGYDLYLPTAYYTLGRKEGKDDMAMQREFREISPSLYAAAWELCRRGIIRPGIKKHGEQAVEGSDGYSITPFGKEWLSEENLDDFVPTEPERFAALLTKYKLKFGPGFHERSMQAVRCYGAHAYLACCAMCGAAAESIMLAAAIVKTGNEGQILKEYASASGRKKIEDVLIGKCKGDLQDAYRNNSSLLKYWRDEAAHGKVSNISDTEAYTSLALLLRFALFVDNNWTALTAK
jgi:hypothetical protein